MHRSEEITWFYQLLYDPRISRDVKIMIILSKIFDSHDKYDNFCNGLKNTHSKITFHGFEQT